MSEPLRQRRPALWVCASAVVSGTKKALHRAAPQSCNRRAQATAGLHSLVARPWKSVQQRRVKS